jgi:TetR/AcrR family transcriptional regulator, acrAB operon repressor
MARKTKEAAAITREGLIDAAEVVFCKYGVTRTSLAEVAAEAGVTRGAVYWHFKNKADLFKAMCARATLPLESMLTAVARADHDDPVGALRNLMVDTLQHLARDPRTQAVFEIVFSKTEACGELGQVAQRRDDERCECLVQVEILVRRGVELGQLPADTDPAVTTQLLQSCMGGIMREWVMNRDAYDLESAAPSMVDCIVAGLTTRPPRRSERIRPRVRARPVQRA